MKFKTLELSEIKDNYFFRTEKWDWLNSEMIQVFDSKNPRVITMDPWPQKIFLEALGQLTVRDYIHKVANEYPKDKVPEGLDDTIIEMINDLVYIQKIMALSNTSQPLDSSLLEPMTEEGEVNLEGIWHGSYQYGIPESYKDDKMIDVKFTLTIDTVKGNTFNGTVEDDLSTGGTPGIGIIKGTFDRNGISFTKNMPVRAIIDGKGNHHIDESKKHTTLIYEGLFSRHKQSISGTWRFKKRLHFWKGFIPIFISLGKGTFSMSKKQ